MALSDGCEDHDPRPEWVPLAYSDGTGCTVWYYARGHETGDVLGSVYTCVAATPRRWMWFGRGGTGTCDTLE